MAERPGFCRAWPLGSGVKRMNFRDTTLDRMESKPNIEIPDRTSNCSRQPICLLAAARLCTPPIRRTVLPFSFSSPTPTCGNCDLPSTFLCVSNVLNGQRCDSRSLCQNPQTSSSSAKSSFGNCVGPRLYWTICWLVLCSWRI